MGQGFGLGVGIDIGRIARHPTGAYGWSGAFGTWFRVDPKENLIFIYLAQFFVSLFPENMPRIFTGVGTPIETLQRLTYAALGS